MEYPIGEEKLIFKPFENKDYIVDVNDIKRKFKSVKATLEIEGLTVTTEMEKLILANATGEISDEEFFKRVVEFEGEK